MDPTRFDALARLVSRPTRRRLLAGALAALLIGAPSASLEAKARPARGRGRRGPSPRDDRSGSRDENGRDGESPTPDRGRGAAIVGKPRKPKKCPRGTLKCGKKCVNPQTDALNCGRCGNRCGAGVACSDGACGGPCDGDRILCGGQCVDPRTDDAHCGTCGNACATGQECRAGSCVATGCPPGQKQCPDTTTCIPEGEKCCRVDFDCGGFNGDLTCDEATSRCVCREGDEGVCRRDANGFGLCDVCCPGGSGRCPGDQVCFDVGTTGLRTCNCPAGTERCAGSNNSFLCQRNRGATDSRRCGIDCVDCTAQNLECCNGRCIGGAAPGSTPGVGTPCAGCQPCQPGTGCCQTSAGSAGYGCVVLDSLGRCPAPPP